MPADPEIVQRRQARSGKSSYGGSVVIRRGQTTYLEVLPQYVSTSSGDRFTPKIRYWKKAAGAFRTGFPAEFTLTDDETRALIRALQEGLAVAKAGEDGEYLVLRLDGVESDMSSHTPVELGKAIKPIISDERVLEAIAKLPGAHDLLSMLEDAVRVGELVEAVGALENALEAGTSDENFYQSWIESHYWIFGNAYAMRDEVRSIAIGDQVDALLAATANGYRDIIELKRPDHEVLGYDRTHKNYYWSRDVSMAIGQCNRYLDALHEAAATGLRDHPEIVAYHPRAIIVVGRSRDWPDAQHKALHGLNSRMHGVTVMTYDQMLALGHQLIDTLRRPS